MKKTMPGIQVWPSLDMSQKMVKLSSESRRVTESMPTVVASKKMVHRRTNKTMMMIRY